MRKLVTIQEISNVTPIEGADRIEVARILGWNVVVGKGEFAVGDKVAYFEVDTLLPINDPRFEKFQSRGVRTSVIETIAKNSEGNDEINSVTYEGHVLKTARLRGVYSQGLVMGLNELGIQNETVDMNIGDSITDLVGVVKYEEPVPVGQGIIGPFDTRFASKTSSLRIQSVSEDWDEIISARWIPTLKTDGTSQTLVNDNGNLRLFSRNWEISLESAGYTTAEECGLVDVLKEYNNMAIQFELLGEINNRMKIDGKMALVFNVWVDGQKLNRKDWDSRIESNGAPILGDEWALKGTVDQIIEKVSTLRGNLTKDQLDEGIVYHLDTSFPYPDSIEKNDSIKIINNKYLIKHKL